MFKKKTLNVLKMDNKVVPLKKFSKVLKIYPRHFSKSYVSI